MDPASTTGHVRVHIRSDTAAADMALPITIPIRELIPRIQWTLATGSDDYPTPSDTNGDGAGRHADTDAEPIRPYSLAPLGGTPFSLDATLQMLAVPEGEPLMLRMLPPGPTAPPVVEDLADAAAIHSAKQFKPFETEMLGPAALVAFLAVGAFITGLGVDGWYRGHGWSAVSTLAGCAVVFIAATVLVHRRGAGEAGARLGVATTVPLALALAAAVPGPGAAPRVFLAAAGVVAWSLLVSTITSRYIAAHTMFIAVGVAVALAAGARILWHLPNVTLGCGVLVASLLLAHNAPTAAARSARWPLPNVPAPGELTPPPPTLAEMEDLPRKAALTHAYQTGYIAASVILAIIGSVLVVWLPARPALLAWWLVVVVALVTVLRMRVWDSAAPSLWFLASPMLTVAALALSFTATGHLVAGLWAAGVLIGLAAVLIGAAALKPGRLPIPRRRWLDLFENALLITILPAMLWLVGLVSLIRNRGSI